MTWRAMEDRLAAWGAPRIKQLGLSVIALLGVAIGLIRALLGLYPLSGEAPDQLRARRWLLIAVVALVVIAVCLACGATDRSEVNETAGGSYRCRMANSQASPTQTQCATTPRRQSAM
jgi:hypothetical protein